MAYLRKTVQGPYAIIVLAEQSGTIPLSTTLETPAAGEFWEIDLVSVRVDMPLTTPQNPTFIANATLTSPQKADIRFAMHSGGFYFLEESMAQGYTRENVYRLIANLASPVVIRPGEELEMTLSFYSFDSAVGAGDAPSIAVGGTFNVLLSGQVTTQEG